MLIRGDTEKSPNGSSVNESKRKVNLLKRLQCLSSHMLLLTPEHWRDYELLDCGNFEKLERFGEFITIRPEPQAVWDRVWDDNEWIRQAHVRFVQRSSSAGDWRNLKKMPEQWAITYNFGEKKNKDLSPIKMRLGLTSFKHVGIFPEQAVNWEYIAEKIGAMKEKNPRFLNLFAYTGAASLAARSAGAEVYHVDSIRQVVSWSRENMERSKLTDIRWVVEDALKFVRRELKRGNKYNGIILDPPAFGHGPTGEKWKLEDHINEMMKGVTELLDDHEHFLILNAYSLGFSSIIIENLLREKAGKNLETGELFLQAKSGVKLPLGVFGRFCNF
jgi:23S rRNA (cytosine1962-C5)-methyltransferase